MTDVEVTIEEMIIVVETMVSAEIMAIEIAVMIVAEMIEEEMTDGVDTIEEIEIEITTEGTEIEMTEEIVSTHEAAATEAMMTGPKEDMTEDIR